MGFLRALWASPNFKSALIALGGAVAAVAGQYFGLIPLPV